MNTKNIALTLFMAFATNFINCSSNSSSSLDASPRTISFCLPKNTPQELLRRGLGRHCFQTVREALQAGANPNEIVDTTPFGERTCFNAYLARNRSNKTILSIMLQGGALPTVDTDRIIESGPRDDLQEELKAMIANHRRNMFRRAIDQYIDGIENTPPSQSKQQHHVDPTALQ